MFTGIVEDVGRVVVLQRGSSSARLTVDAPVASQGVVIGDSVSVSGVCLTVVEHSSGRLSFDAVPETLHRSSLKSIRVGDAVNLERALAVGQRLGGHFVQGHVDGTGELASVSTNDNARILKIRAATELLRYMIPKGSVSLDGISLTVADVSAQDFTVWIIPHTWQSTTLHFRKPGDMLNIEVDMLAKYIERLLPGLAQAKEVDSKMLAEAGFE